MSEKTKFMKSPCIQITPVFPNDNNEWAVILTYFLSLKGMIEEKIGLPFIVDIKETGAQKVQCNNSDNGYHEFIDSEIKDLENYMLCIHCGSLVVKSGKTKEELDQFFKEKRFKEKEIIERKISG